MRKVVLALCLLVNVAVVVRYYGQEEETSKATTGSSYHSADALLRVQGHRLPNLHYPDQCVKIVDEAGNLQSTLDTLAEKEKDIARSKSTFGGALNFITSFGGGFKAESAAIRPSVEMCGATDGIWYYLWALRSIGDGRDLTYEALESLVQEGKATVVQSKPVLDCDIPKIRGEDWDGDLFDVKGASATMASTYIKKLSFEYESYSFNAKDLKKFASDHSMTITPLLRTKYIPCNVHSCFCQVKIQLGPGFFEGPLSEYTV